MWRKRSTEQIQNMMVKVNPDVLLINRNVKRNAPIKEL